jgi:hypothetical protein
MSDNAGRPSDAGEYVDADESCGTTRSSIATSASRIPYHGPRWSVSGANSMER